MKRLRDIFDEEIKKGDILLYCYKNYGVMTWIYGEVLDIHKHDVTYYHCGYEWRLTVRRICERSWNKKWERVNPRIVYLTNPSAICWHEEIPECKGDRK